MEMMEATDPFILFRLWFDAATAQSREQLDARLDELDRRFRAAAVPRPEHWSGFRVIPNRVEFWHARPSRLHDRLRFTLDRVDRRWVPAPI